jgi:Plasmid encoded RepA protein
MSSKKKGLTQIGSVVTPQLLMEIKGPSRIQKRLIEASVAAYAEEPDSISRLYQHSVLCQTYFPYRDPGDQAHTWERVNGDVHLEITARKAMHPVEHRLVRIGLPFGPKCRLVLMHINQLAIVKQSPHIEVEDSLTAFVRRVLKLDPKGRNITEVKAQLSRLATAEITLGLVNDNTAGTDAGTGYISVVKDFNVWLPKDERQRVLWPSVIDLSLDYFQSLLTHAVPLNELHIAALSHSGLALDIYAWLAQRLHRIPPDKPTFVSWAALHGQFGQGYNPARMDKFRAVFRVALTEVLQVYKAARITQDERRPPRRVLQGGKQVWRERPAQGLTLYNSLPPVPRRLHVVC